MAFLISFFFIYDRPFAFIVCYFLSFFLDVFDGPVARYFGQSTLFGAALDMLTDKFTTPALCMALVNLYPEYAVLFTFTLVLDIVSHYFHIQETLLSGRTHHKNIEEDKNFLIKLFYGNKMFFGWTCLGYEGFLLVCYTIQHVEQGSAFYTLLFYARVL